MGVPGCRQSEKVWFGLRCGRMCYTNIQPKGESEPKILGCGLQSNASRFQGSNLYLGLAIGLRVVGGTELQSCPL